MSVSRTNNIQAEIKEEAITKIFNINASQNKTQKSINSATNCSNQLRQVGKEIPSIFGTGLTKHFECN